MKRFVAWLRGRPAWIVDHTEKVKNLATAAALVAGGLWTFWVFDVELRRENARAQLEKLEREAAELSTSFGIEVNPLSDPSSRDAHCYFEILVTAENRGVNAVALLDPVLVVSRVQGVAADGGPILLNPVVAAYAWQDSRGTVYLSDRETVGAGDRRSITFLVQLPSDALYHVSFSAGTGDGGTRSGATGGNRPVWTAGRYLQVASRREDGLCPLGPTREPAAP